jgi:PAS domain S-box-containing protein
VLLEQNLLSTANLLSVALDRDLSISQASLEALATSPALASGDMAAFHAQALNVLKNFPDSDIILADATGQQIINTYKAFGSALPKRATLNTVRRIFETGKPIFSNVFKGAVTGRYLIGIDVPVFLDGQVRYDLGMTLPADRLLALLRPEGLPGNWLITILDGDNAIAARSKLPEVYVGKHIESPPLLRLLAVANEGATEGFNLEGELSTISFRRSDMTGWTVLVSSPKVLMVNSLKQWLWWTLAGLSLLLAFGTGMALGITRIITRSVQDLIPPALAIGRGEYVEPGHFELTETNEVAKALSLAGNLLNERDTARKQAKNALKKMNETLEELIVKRTEQLVAANEALKRNEAQLRSFIEQAPASLAMFDTEMRYLGASRRWLSDYGLGERDLSGMSHYEIFPEISAEWREAHRRGMAGEVLQAEADRFERADGTVQWVRWVIQPWINIAGEIGGILIFTEDISKTIKAEELLKASLAEKEVLLREIHHRVKNNLQVISSLVSLQADNLTDERMREEFNDVCDRIRSMALIHEKLYQTGDLAQLNFADYAASLLHYLWNSYDVLAGKVRLHLALTPMVLSIEIAVPCGLILNELAGNALKHAFPNNSSGEVTVGLDHDAAAGTVCLWVRDNGVGLPAGLDWRQCGSLGLRLVDILASQLRGTVATGTGPGTEFRVTFSLNGFQS